MRRCWGPQAAALLCRHLQTEAGSKKKKKIKAGCGFTCSGQLTSQAQYNHATATTAKLELKQNPGATAGLRMDYWIAFCLVKYLTAFVSESLLPKKTRRFC